MSYTALFLILSMLDPVQSVPSKVVQLKVTHSAHLTVYFTAAFRESVPTLIEDAEKFIRRLEKRWWVSLPNERIQVSIGKGKVRVGVANHFEGPSWLQSSYNVRQRRIELFISKPSQLRTAPVSRALHHHLVHHLLNLSPENKLPSFMEEGFARYYGGPGWDRDRSLVIWFFNKHKDAGLYLTQARNFVEEKEFPYAAALSRRFVSWLWRYRPEGEIPLIQAFLKGRSFELALQDAGFNQNAMSLLFLFDLESRPAYGIYTFLYTLDFWLVFLGMAMLVWMLFHVMRALRNARMVFRELGSPMADGTEIGVGKEMFTGPVFQGIDKEWQEPVSSPVSGGEAGWGGIEPDRDFHGLDRDVDRAFEEILPKDHPVRAPKAKKSLNEDIDEDLDKVFEDWGS